MTKLEELLYSLGTVLISYHDSQMSDDQKIIFESDSLSLEKRRMDYATALIQNKKIQAGRPVDFKKEFETMIVKCTQGYAERKPFLNFLLHEILFLKSLHEQTTPFSPSELDEYKMQIKQLFIDFKTLLSTKKGVMNSIQHSQMSSALKTDDSSAPTTSSSTVTSRAAISLSGLMNTGWSGYDKSTSNHILCKSGDILNDQVLSRFNIPFCFPYGKVTPFSADEVPKIAEDLCNEHQNALLASLFTAQLASKDAELAAKSAKVEVLEKDLQSASEQRLHDASLLASQATQISKLKEVIGTLEQKVSDLSNGATPLTAYPGRFFGLQGMRRVMNSPDDPFFPYRMPQLFPSTSASDPD